MRNPIRSRNTAFFAAGGFAAALFLAGAAHAITDTIFRYSTPRTGYLAIDAAGFSPLTAAAADAFAIYYVYDGLISTTAAGSCFGTSVTLPQGAKMTALAIWYQKSAQISLVRHRPSDGTAMSIANRGFTTSQTAIKPGNIDITNASLQVVDNAHYTYGLVACLPQTSGYFYGARVTYTYANAGD